MSRLSASTFVLETQQHSWDVGTSLILKTSPDSFRAYLLLSKLKNDAINTLC